MTPTPDPMPNQAPTAHPPRPADHAAHDPELVAAYAAGDATGARLDEASALVATCSACAALHHDLRAIARALPATAAAAPVPRPRDFRLTADQAAALRPSGWRRLLAPLAGPSFAFARPLGTGLATLGLAGLLVAGASGIPLGGAASAPGGQEEAFAPLSAGGDDASPAGASPAQDELFQVNAAATEAPVAGGGGGPGGLPAPASAAPGEERNGASSTTPPGGEQPTTGTEMLATAGSPAVAGDDGAAAKETAPAVGAWSPVPVLAAAGMAALAAGVLLLALRSLARRVA